MTQSMLDGVPMYECNTAVVGSGAAGFNAADCLWSGGQTDIILVTDHIHAGTSRNTGSDKQTYYKLTLSGSEPDSVREMAQTLFSGQCVDGDLALCEAALSAPCFFKLAELGVPFPKNRYGEFVGYKTDHDPRRRATSAGPYTSRCMTECLEQAVKKKGVPILDELQVVSILRSKDAVCGLLCLNLAAQQNETQRFVLVCCKNIIYATGGPAGMYADSVYPKGHYGATGTALEAGILGRNLTEWQYGLASVHPRWNVSGTYMQALPRVFSAAPDGSDEREFLNDYFPEPAELLTRIFLKGYQWPFDVRKAANGSSLIDLLVLRETQKGRKVYLDYRTNPCAGKVDFQALSAEARSYLEKAEACFGTPFDRLMQMNAPAVEFYREKGVDLASEPLEIALCAQHNNGGLAVDAWWRTNLQGFFAIGEAAATHGVYRPGGTALNSGQVGAVRASEYIAAYRTGRYDDPAEFRHSAQQAIKKARSIKAAVLSENTSNVDKIWQEAARRMSNIGAAIRDIRQIVPAVNQTKELVENFSSLVRIQDVGELDKVFRLRDMLLCQYVYLSAMKDYIETGGRSRGSALYIDPDGKAPLTALPDAFAYTLDDGARGSMVQEVQLSENGCAFLWRKVRPIPNSDDFFENVWKGYRENKNII